MNKNLIKIIQKATLNIDGQVRANCSTYFPGFITSRKTYTLSDVAVSLDENGFLKDAYLCLEKDELGNPAAVPIEYFEV